MKMNKQEQRELHLMLDEALDRVLKGEDINTVLADYPRFAQEIAPVLQIARAGRKARDIKPRPEFRQRAAMDFQKAIQAMPVKAAGGKAASRWRLAWVLPTAVFALLLVSGTGLVAASTNSLPGSPLYNVKLAAENVQMAFTPSDIGKAELYAKFNDRRVDELVAISAQSGGVELAAEIDELNTRMISNMNSIADLTGGTSNTAAAGSKYMIDTPETTTPASISDAYNSATTVAPQTRTTSTTTVPTTRPAVLPPVTTTATITEPVIIGPSTQQGPPSSTTTETTEPPASSTTSVDIPVTSTTAITVPPATSTVVILTATESAGPEGTPGVGSARHSALSNEERQLAKLLSEKQQKNLEKLEAAWEKAPDWIKPLIRHAIEIILYGYDTSISNLSD
jgi:hypothetical protein